MTALEMTFWFYVVGTVACLPWTFELVGVVGDASAADLGWIAYLGIVPSALAFVTWAYALNRSDAGKFALSTFLVPFITTLMAWCSSARCRRRWRSSAARCASPACCSPARSRGSPNPPRSPPDLTCCAHGRRRRRARRSGRGAAPLLPGARDVPVDQADRPQGFGNDPEFAEATKVLAADQGLYNGFLVAGLVWGLVSSRTTCRSSSWPASSSRAVRRGDGQRADPARAGGAGATRSRRGPARR